MKRVLLLVLALGVGGCATTLRPARVAPSFAEVFAGTYVAQQAGRGRTDVSRATLSAAATCRRTGPDPDGPGEDWTCTVRYDDLGRTSTGTWEVQVKPDGCWSAQAPPTAQPAELVDPRTGARSRNRLAVFDGCVDTSIGA